MDQRLSQLLKHSKETGERLVILPEGGGEPFVLLGLAEYRKLRSGSGTGQVKRNDELPALTDDYEFEPVNHGENS